MLSSSTTVLSSLYLKPCLVQIMLIVIFALIGFSGPSFAASDSIVYQYDALGRVTSASYGTGVVVTYTYDASGNRLSQAVTGPGLVWTPYANPCPSNCWGSAFWSQ